MASLDEAITRRSPSGATSMSPAAADVEHVDAAVGEQRQQLDDVEVGDERVGQLDSVLASSASLGIGSPVTSGSAMVGRGSGA